MNMPLESAKYKILFLGFPSSGHVNPTLNLIKALVSRGHDVIYYADEKYRPKITSTGAVFRAYPFELDPGEDDTGHRNETDFIEALLKMGLGLMELTTRLMTMILEQIQTEKPDCIMHDSFAYWGKQIACLLKIPAVSSITVAPVTPDVIDRRPEATLQYVLRTTREDLQKKYQVNSPREIVDKLSFYVREKYGLGDDFHFFDLFISGGDLNLVYTSRFFQFESDCFDERYKFIGPSFVSTAQTGDFPFHLPDEKPLLYISMGTVFNRRLSFYQKCIDLFGDDEYQVVMTIGDKIAVGDLGTIPSNFIARNFVPQLSILARASVFITHGGANSVHESIVYEVPMVVVPQAADQFILAGQVEKFGAGISLDPHRIEDEPQLLKNAVKKIISDPLYRRNCSTIKQSFQSCGGVTQAVDEITWYIHASKVKLSPAVPEQKVNKQAIKEIKFDF